MNTILERLEKIKGYVVVQDWRNMALYSLIFASLVAAFFLGVIWESQKDHNTKGILYAEIPQSTPLASVPTPVVDEAGNSGQYVGSKNGSKYHLPWCSGAQRIKEENKVWFQDKNEAKRLGYTPAKNCPGI